MDLVFNTFNTSFLKRKVSSSEVNQEGRAQDSEARVPLLNNAFLLLIKNLYRKYKVVRYEARLKRARRDSINWILRKQIIYLASVKNKNIPL